MIDRQKPEPFFMTRKAALALKEEFISLALKHGIWYDIHESNKPDLKYLVLTTSIKVVEK